MTTHHTEGIAQNTYSPYLLALFLLNVVVRVNCTITVVGAVSYRSYKKSKKAAESLERGLPSISSYIRNHFHRKIDDRARLYESRLTLIYDEQLIEVFISLFKSGFKA